MSPSLQSLAKRLGSLDTMDRSKPGQWHAVDWRPWTAPSTTALNRCSEAYAKWESNPNPKTELALGKARTLHRDICKLSDEDATKLFRSLGGYGQAKREVDMDADFAVNGEGS
jgi:hypothetical protein